MSNILNPRLETYNYPDDFKILQQPPNLQLNNQEEKTKTMLEILWNSVPFSIGTSDQVSTINNNGLNEDVDGFKSQSSDFGIQRSKCPVCELLDSDNHNHDENDNTNLYKRSIPLNKSEATSNITVYTIRTENAADASIKIWIPNTNDVGALSSLEHEQQSKALERSAAPHHRSHSHFFRKHHHQGKGNFATTIPVQTIIQPVITQTIPVMTQNQVAFQGNGRFVPAITQPVFGIQTFSQPNIYTTTQSISSSQAISGTQATAGSQFIPGHRIPSSNAISGAQSFSNNQGIFTSSQATASTQSQLNAVSSGHGNVIEFPVNTFMMRSSQEPNDKQKSKIHDRSYEETPLLNSDDDFKAPESTDTVSSPFLLDIPNFDFDVNSKPEYRSSSVPSIASGNLYTHQNIMPIENFLAHHDVDSNKTTHFFGTSRQSANDMILSHYINKMGLEEHSNFGFPVLSPESVYARTSEHNKNVEDVTDIDLNDILSLQKEKVQSIKSNSTGDVDLLMIGFIGDSLVNDMEQRSSSHNSRRDKRQATGTLAFTRLMTNPNARLDVEKTLDNIGTATKNAFENSRAPLYHIRNLLGNAKNTFMSGLKIAPHDILVPSKYNILRNPKKNDDTLKAINMEFIKNDKSLAKESSRSIQNTDDTFGILGTFQRIGKVVKDSVDSSRNAIVHAADVAHDARKAITSTQFAVPRLVIPAMKIPVVTSYHQKTMLITPRLLDVQEETVGSSPDLPAEFVSMGQVLDAIGISKPTNNKLQIQKVFLDQKAAPLPTLTSRTAKFIKPKEFEFSPAFKQWFLNSAYDQNERLLQTTLSELKQAKQSVGVKSFREFLDTMKKTFHDRLQPQEEKLKMIPSALNSRANFNEESKEIEDRVKHVINPPFGVKTNESHDSESRNMNTLDCSQDAISNERVGLDLPENLLHPFMDQASDAQIEQFLNGNMNTNETTQTEDYPDSVVGSINTVMFERYLKHESENSTESKGNKNQTKNVHGLKGKTNQQRTSMKILDQYKKPFMGSATEQNIKTFLHQFNVDDSKEDLPVQPAWLISSETSESGEVY